MRVRLRSLLTLHLSGPFPCIELRPPCTLVAVVAGAEPIMPPSASGSASGAWVRIHSAGRSSRVSASRRWSVQCRVLIPSACGSPTFRLRGLPRSCSTDGAKVHQQFGIRSRGLALPSTQAASTVVRARPGWVWLDSPERRAVCGVPERAWDDRARDRRLAIGTVTGSNWRLQQAGATRWSCRDGTLKRASATKLGDCNVPSRSSAASAVAAAGRR